MDTNRMQEMGNCSQISQRVFENAIGYAARVAAGVPPAVEGGILPPGNTANSSDRLAFSCVPAAGQDARLHGRRDACRYI
jgi:hypothetical protein